MHSGRASFAAAVTCVLAAATLARADYHSHPELLPESRCVTADGKRFDKPLGDPLNTAGIDPLHCQKLFWDIPVTTAIGHKVIAAPAFEDTVPRWPRGLSDRIPPMYVGANGDGYEHLTDCEADNGAGNCERLCPDLQVPYWAETVNPETGQVVHGIDGVDTPPHGLTAFDERTGEQLKDGDGNPVPITGPIMTLQCRRGVRTYFGPWQVGTDPAVFDGETSNQNVKFENTALLDHDEALNGEPRLEWNVGSEFYNHFSSHHGTCYQPSEECMNPNNPKPGSAYDANDPTAECYEYEKATEPDGGCYAADEDPGCRATRDRNGDGEINNDDRLQMGGFRNATQVPGRLSVPIPGGRGVIGTEDVVWGCNHHVVHQLPPGSYSMTELADFRLMKGGLTNTTGREIYGVPNGQVIGGSVGEMVIQYFTEPLGADVKPVNVAFNAVADAATTYYPPFTWNYHEAEWFAPFDAAVALGAIHSHHRMVKGIQSVSPANPPRLNSDNPLCGGWGTGEIPTDIYTNWYWEDAPVCEWWREPDGPVILRKGQSIRTACYVNNGVTPEAIKHGLVAGSTVQALKILGAPIPEYPALVPAATWGDPLKNSAVGTELLYGKHEPINYRVVYKCSDSRLGHAPGSSVLNFPFVSAHEVCDPNPAVDGDLDYVDGPYANEAQCGPGGRCEPSSIIFACVGEDEMCIGVNMYWGLARLGSDRNEEAAAALEEAVTTQNPEKLDEVGTPGNTGAPTDTIPGVFEAGNCPECAGAPSL